MQRSNKIVPLLFPKVEVVYVEETCSICLDNWEKVSRVVLPCGHSFHSNCILTWMDTHQSCPVCRISLRWSR